MALVMDFKKMPHALALTGLLESARLEAWNLAKALLCETENGCGSCGSCLRIEKQQHESVLYLAPENNVIKLESAQRINEFLSLSRMSKARVIVVSDAQTLNVQATNAILKIVEEPPPSTYFLFLTPEVSQLLPTLRSRVQVIRLKPLPRQFDESLLELRDSTAKFLTSCFQGQRGHVGDFLEMAKDRESAVQAAQLLQQLLRDWSVAGSGHEFHAGVNQEGWPQLELSDRVQLWRLAHQIETDLNAHVDRSLVFENFFYQVGGYAHAVD